MKWSRCECVRCVVNAKVRGSRGKCRCARPRGPCLSINHHTHNIISRVLGEAVVLRAWWCSAVLAGTILYSYVPSARVFTRESILNFSTLESIIY